MGSSQTRKPHILCFPAPAQGHISPFMLLAQLLHSQGCHITFVNTEFNHKRLVRSQGPESVKGLPDFQFEAIPDGLPPSDKDATQHLPDMCDSLRKHCYQPLKELVMKLNSSTELPKVSCIISDIATTSFAGKVAKDLGIPEMQLFTASACGFMGYLQFDELVKRGIVPFKDENFLVDGTLDTSIDWIPGMKNVRLKDLPAWMRITKLEDIMFDVMGSDAQKCLRSSSMIINTFEELERDVLDAIKAMNPNVYCIGPLHILARNFLQKEHFKLSSSSLWKNDSECIPWLDKWDPSSVIYVNYGSIAVLTEQQFKEFAWGLANSKQPFLWVARTDVVKGESANLPEEFLDEIKDRGYITTWCPQEQVLAHPSIGAYLTHCGWNSTIESISEGVPMICWPSFAEQLTNCRYACNIWGIGTEISSDVKREEIADLVIDVMKGDKGKEIREKALEWKKKARVASDVGGSSYVDFKRLMKDVIHYDD